MTIALTDHKKQRIKLMVKDKVRSQPYGKLLPYQAILWPLEAIRYDRLYYRYKEYDKITALKSSQDNFETQCPLNPSAIEELKWWENNNLNSFCVMISNPEIDYIIYLEQAPKTGVFIILLRQ